MSSAFVLLPVKDASSGSRLWTLVSIVAAIAGFYFGRQGLISLALALVRAFLFAFSFMPI